MSSGLKSLDLLFLAIDVAMMEINSQDPLVAAAAKEFVMILSPIKGAIILGPKAVKRLEETIIQFANSEMTIIDNGDPSDF